MEALDGRFVTLWDSSAVRTHDPTSRDSNLGPISLARERFLCLLFFINYFKMLLVDNYYSVKHRCHICLVQTDECSCMIKEKYLASSI